MFPSERGPKARSGPHGATGGVSAYHGDMLADARSAVQANFMSGATRKKVLDWSGWMREFENCCPC